MSVFNTKRSKNNTLSQFTRQKPIMTVFPPRNSLAASKPIHVESTISIRKSPISTQLDKVITSCIGFEDSMRRTKNFMQRTASSKFSPKNWKNPVTVNTVTTDPEYQKIKQIIRSRTNSNTDQYAQEIIGSLARGRKSSDASSQSVFLSFSDFETKKASQILSQHKRNFGERMMKSQPLSRGLREPAGQMPHPRYIKELISPTEIRKSLTIRPEILKSQKAIEQYIKHTLATVLPTNK